VLISFNCNVFHTKSVQEENESEKEDKKIEKQENELPITEEENVER